MDNETNEQPWIYDYKELFDLNKILDILPDDFTINGLLTTKSLNSISRFILLVGVISYIRTPKIRIILLTMIVLFMVVQLFSYTKDIKEYFGEPLQKLDAYSEQNILEQLIEQGNMYDVSLNNPYNNPNPYANCQGIQGNNLEKVGGIGSRKINNSVLRPYKPSEEELMIFQKSLIGDSEPFQGLTVSSSNIDALKAQQTNIGFRQFYTLPVNDCINNQKDFAIGLYGDPEKPTFKQKVYETPETKLRNN